jgi:ABC-2 type transport system permease protein
VPTIFLYSLRRFRGPIIAWGLVFFLIGWPLVAVYDTMLERRQELEKVMAGFGKLIAAFAPKNVNFSKIDSPDTFLSLRYFSFMPIILGIYAVLSGSGLLAADEESGTLDLVLAHPVSRTGLFFGRFLGLMAATLVILAIAWAGVILPMNGTALGDKVSPGQVLLPFLSVLALVVFFCTLALLLSMVLPSRRLAAMTAGFILLAGFFLSGFARAMASPLAGGTMQPTTSESVWEIVAQLSPLDYYQGGEAINGLNFTWFGGLLAVAGLFTALAWWCFERRDIRVAGEGSWHWPWLRRRTAVG